MTMPQRGTHNSLIINEFWNNSETRFFKNSKKNLKIIFYNSLTFSEESREIYGSVVSQEFKKPILGPFCPILGRTGYFFEKFRKSLFYVNWTLTKTEKSAKTVKPFSRYSNLKNRAIWLAESFSRISWERNFSKIQKKI